MQRTELRPVIGSKLRRLLQLLLVLCALLFINSTYLSSLTVLEYFSADIHQDLFYQYMFLVHLVLGLALILPLIIYGAIHWRNAWHRPNRRAVAAGLTTFFFAIMVLITGILLMRGFPWFEIASEGSRRVIYWLHFALPLLSIWMFVLHRLAGKRLQLKRGGVVIFIMLLTAAGTISLYHYVPKPEPKLTHFEPALTILESDHPVDLGLMMDNDYCAECHGDVHNAWQASVHHLSSFNNPAYEFSVNESRATFLARDGDVKAARFCAACHDQMPLIAGLFDDPEFSKTSHVSAQAGINCLGCHAITHINGTRGNGDYTISPPTEYPFRKSDSEFFKWINRTAIKAKPALHKQSMLKDFHSTAEFCSVCHKVSLTPEINDYHWLRGQNHYDSYLLSGVSGHGVTSFYYPQQAVDNCQTCHMSWVESDDFAARQVSGKSVVHDHLFPSANTAIPALKGYGQDVIDQHQSFLADSVTVDLIGLREQGQIDGRLTPVTEQVIDDLKPGNNYLLEMIIRTKTLGHIFTQGTADSNQVWLEVELLDAEGKRVGASGLLDPQTGEVDPWSHFVNAYVLDRLGNRIDRRQAEDIFTVLYNHQIPPGAADVIHYAFSMDESVRQPLTVKARLRYRKFDTHYLRLFQSDKDAVNTLVVTDIDTMISPGLTADTEKPEWMRWNDYGIGLLRKTGAGQLRQAEQAFQQVIEYGVADGYLNLARVYLREGRLADAEQMLTIAATRSDLASPWTVTWLSAQLDEQNGFFAEAIEKYQLLLETRFNSAVNRGFDFSSDYRLRERLASTWFERARQVRNDQEQYQQALQHAKQQYQLVLEQDPERASSHYGIAQVYTAMGDTQEAQAHLKLHGYYKVDDNARDFAIAEARRRDPVADHAAENVVIYDLNRHVDSQTTSGSNPN